MPRRRKPHKQPPPALVKDLAEWLGRVMIATSQMEHSLAIALGDMLKLTKLQYSAMIIPMSTATKVKLLRQLGKEYLSGASFGSLKTQLAKIEKCAEIRNSLVHGFYGTKKGKFELITHSGEGRFSGQPVSWNPKSLEALCRRILSANATVPHVRHSFPTRLSRPKNRQPILPFDEP
jgi:hypothetical protein